MCVRVCMCVRITSILSWQQARPLSLLLPFFSVSLSATAVFPRGNWVTESTYTDFSFVLQPTILPGGGNITAGLRLNLVQLSGLRFFFLFFLIFTTGLILLSLECLHHRSVFSSVALLFIILSAGSLRPSVISLTVYL